MALSKERLKKEIEGDLQALVAEATERVDRQLREQAVKYGMRGYVTFSTRGMWRGVIDALLVAYRAAGWRVEYIDDQRDGSFLQFWY